MSFGTSANAVVGTLCFWRFFLGFGVGGDYPLSATIMSEYSSRLSRGAFVSAVFAMQGVGILTAATVSIIVTSCFNGYYPAPPYPADDMAGNPALYWSQIQASTPHACDYIWRIVLGFGFFPASCTLYMRSTMPETPRYTLHVLRDKAKVAADMASVTRSEVDSTHTVASTKADMTFLQFLRKHGKELLGCAMCWFLLDGACRDGGRRAALTRAPLRSRLLLAEPLPKGRVPADRLAAAAGDGQLHDGDVPRGARAGAHRARLHHPRLLLHGAQRSVCAPAALELTRVCPRRYSRLTRWAVATSSTWASSS